MLPCGKCTVALVCLFRRGRTCGAGTTFRHAGEGMHGATLGMPVCCTVTIWEKTEATLAYRRDGKFRENLSTLRTCFFTLAISLTTSGSRTVVFVHIGHVPKFRGPVCLQ